MKRVVRILIVLGVIQLVLVAAYVLFDRARPAPPLGTRPLDRDAAPAIAWTRDDQPPGRLELRHGRPLLLHFWATWCPPCRDELPALLDLARHGEVDVVAAALDPEWDRVARFFGSHPVPEQVVRVTAADARALYGVEALPETFVIGADGRLRFRVAGAVDWRDDGVREWLEGATE